MQPKPCHKFQDGTADIGTWVAHINNEKCPKCLALARYFEHEFERETRMLKALWQCRTDERSVRPIKLPQWHAWSRFDEARLANPRSVFQSAVHSSRGINFGSAFSAQFWRFIHDTEILARILVANKRRI
jgi:hypothetical protein